MSNRCTVDGAIIDYTDSGSGPVVVFVHGVYVTGAIWDRVIAELGDRVRSIAPTWPLVHTIRFLTASIWPPPQRRDVWCAFSKCWICAT